MMMRAAHMMDASRTGAILSGFVAETPWMPRLHSAAEDISFAETMITRGWVTVAGRKDQVEAFIARDADTVHALYVAGTARRAGLGSALLNRAKAAMDRLTLWTFEANGPAQNFYEAHDFRVVDRTDGSGNDEGLPDLRYVWEKP